MTQEETKKLEHIIGCLKPIKQKHEECKDDPKSELRLLPELTHGLDRIFEELCDKHGDGWLQEKQGNMYIHDPHFEQLIKEYKQKRANFGISDRSELIEKINEAEKKTTKRNDVIDWALGDQ